MKKPESKADLRADLERATKRFLHEGGEVKAVPRGTSGVDQFDTASYVAGRLFTEPRGERTLVPEVVAAIEQRRQALRKRSSPARPTRQRSPRRKTIYDDFGEPLRRVWVDD